MLHARCFVTELHIIDTTASVKDPEFAYKRRTL